MFHIVVLSVAAGAVLVVSVLAIMFLDVAFDPMLGRFAQAARNRWRLPLLSGEELKRWAKVMTERIVLKRAAQTRNRQTPVDIASEIFESSGAVIDQIVPTDRRPRSKAQNCSSRCHEMIGVTGPEALAIADELMRNQSRSTVEKIRERARANAERASGLNHTQFPIAKLTCPLFTSDGRCATFESRPLYCRGQCPECTGGPGCERVTQGISESQVFAATVGQGVMAGLTSGLASSGLDNHVYELNSALTAALSKPDAAACWAQGDPVFSGCKEYE